MQNSPVSSLRHRKKLDTTLGVQRVAVDLAIAHGSDDVTVDDICAGSNISVRTFFNYFPTKEAAILGNALELIDAVEVRVLLSSHPGNTLRGVVAILDRCFSASDAEPDLLLRRKALMEAEPQLIPRQMRALDRLEDELADAVSDWLDSLPRGQRSTGLPSNDEAHLTVLLAGTVMRRSIMRWVSSKGAISRADAIESTLAQLTQIAKVTQ